MANRRINVEIIGDSRSVERAFKRAGGAANTFSGKMGRAAKGVTKGFAVAGIAAAGLAVAVGVKSVQAAAGFEKTMSRVIGLAGQSQKQVAAWSDQLLSLGPALGKTPQELAEALYFIASSGIPAGKAISVLAASAKASAAGLGETEIVADAVTSVMNAYGISAMSAARATDVLVATVREGKGEANAFAPVIGNVTAFASRLKVRFEEVGAALASMTQLGTDPATAATQLQAFFSQILKPAPKAEKAAAKVGLSFDTLRETLSRRGLLETLDLIKERFKGNTKALAQSFPNIRALRALLALTAADGGKVAGVFARMGASSGSLGNAFAAAQQTASFNMDKFKASIESLKIAFGQGLLPVVTKVAQALAQKLADPAFVAKVRELGTLIGTKLYNALAAVGTWFVNHWPQIQQGFRTTATIIGAIVTGVGKLVAVFKAVAPLIAALIQNSLIRPMKLVLAVWSGILEGLTHIPLIGGKFKGALEAVNTAREGVRGVERGLEREQAREAQKRNPRTNAQAGARGIVPGQGRARGGPAFAGMTYRVGERGPEMLTMGRSSGHITANGGGGVHIAGDVHLHGIQNVHQFWRELQRLGNSTAGSRRGRYGGQKLALG